MSPGAAFVLGMVVMACIWLLSAVGEEPFDIEDQADENERERRRFEDWND